VEWIAYKWLIEWIIANNIYVISKVGRCVIPESVELVLKTLLVLIKSLPEVEALLCSVELTKVTGVLTILNKRVSVVIQTETIV